MKNIKILLVPVAMFSIVGVANGFRLKDYMIGAQIDKEGRTIFHVTAERCDDLDRFAQRMMIEAVALSTLEPNLELATEEPSLFTKDNKGRIAVDIAEMKYKETGHSDCMQMIIEYKERMQQEEKDNKDKENN